MLFIHLSLIHPRCRHKIEIRRHKKMICFTLHCFSKLCEHGLLLAKKFSLVPTWSSLLKQHMRSSMKIIVGWMSFYHGEWLHYKITNFPIPSLLACYATKRSWLKKHFALAIEFQPWVCHKHLKHFMPCYVIALDSLIKDEETLWKFYHLFDVFWVQSVYLLLLLLSNLFLELGITASK